MNCYRRFLILGVALALTVGMSCTSSNFPLDTGDDGAVPTGDGGGVPTGDSGGVPTGDSGGVPTGDSGGVPTGDSGGVPTGDGGDVPTGDGGDVPDPVGLLLCAPLPYATTTAVIGPTGGEIIVGDHVLKIPEYALSEEVAITAERMVGLVNSVRLTPEGLQFKKSAELTLSYKNCMTLRLPKRIAYTDEWLRIIESLPSVDSSSSKKVKSPIDHFSRYAVAY